MNYEIHEKYDRLVRYLAKSIYVRLPKGMVELDDLVSEGFVGYLRACQKYDEKISSNFAYYATIKIRGAILDYLRREKPHHWRCASRSMPPPNINADKTLMSPRVTNNEVNLDCVIQSDAISPVEALLLSEKCDLLKKFANGLTPRLKQLLALRMKDLDIKEIADFMNTNENNVRRLKYRLEKKLQEFLTYYNRL